MWLVAEAERGRRLRSSCSTWQRRAFVRTQRWIIVSAGSLSCACMLWTFCIQRYGIGPSQICGSFSWVDSWGGQTLRGGQPPPPIMMRCSSSHPQLLPPRPVVIERTLRAPSPSLVSSPTAKPLASQPPQRPPDPPTPACPPRAARGCGGRFLAAVLGLAALKVPRGGGKFKHSRRAAVAAAQPPCPAWRRLLGRLQLTCGGRCARWAESAICGSCRPQRPSRWSW